MSIANRIFIPKIFKNFTKKWEKRKKLHVEKAQKMKKNFGYRNKFSFFSIGKKTILSSLDT